MEPETLLMLSLIIGSIGVAYFVYGKKQGRPVPLISGIVLCAYPYFITNTVLFFGIGVVFAVLPFFIRE